MCMSCAGAFTRNCICGIILCNSREALFQSWCRAVQEMACGLLCLVGDGECVCVCVCAPKAQLPKGNGWDVDHMGTGRRVGPDTKFVISRKSELERVH